FFLTRHYMIFIIARFSVTGPGSRPGLSCTGLESMPRPTHRATAMPTTEGDTMRTPRLRRIASRCLLAAGAAAVTAAVHTRADATITLSADPNALSAAIEHVPGTVTGAAFEALPPSGTPHAIGSAAGTSSALVGFP